MDKTSNERIASLETADFYEKRALQEMQERLDALEAKMAYYDKMAARWGGICIATITIFSAIGMLWDKIGDKLTVWLSK